jgi:hypothetical protein
MKILTDFVNFRYLGPQHGVAAGRHGVAYSAAVRRKVLWCAPWRVVPFGSQGQWAARALDGSLRGGWTGLLGTDMGHSTTYVGGYARLSMKLGRLRLSRTIVCVVIFLKALSMQLSHPRSVCTGKTQDLGIKDRMMMTLGAAVPPGGIIL